MTDTIPFTIITPTGDRPIPFALCCQYVQRQTVLPAEWIVVDDGREGPTQVPDLPWVKYIRRQNREFPNHSLTMQMVRALQEVTTDHVIIMEDDDWYSPNYCEYMLGLLRGRDIAGIGNTVYYNVPERRYFVHDNREHSAWCNTAFHRRLFPKIQQTAQDCHRRNYPYMDLTLWRNGKGWSKRLDLSNPKITIGIKGMPGRLGTCSGHRSTDRFTQDTHTCRFLRRTIGDDVGLYTPYMRQPSKSDKCGVSVVTLVSHERMYRMNVAGTLPPDRVQLIPIRKARSAAWGLNQGIALARNDLVVCCHQDVRFSKGWIDALLSQISLLPVKDFGILGTYGISLTSHGSGHVISGSHKVLNNGKPPEECFYLDEHCLVIRKSSGLRFDEACPGFDMYGADLCLTAWERGMSCFSVKALLHHLSDNQGGSPNLKKATEWLVSKWKGKSRFKKYRTTCVGGIEL